jgi:hypothetical protein
MVSEKRYPLLLYAEWMRPLRIPAFILMILFSGLFAAAVTGLLQKAGVTPVPLADVLLGIAAIVSAALWLMLVLLPRAAYVLCRPDFLLVRIGFLRLVVSYSRIRTARTVQHAQIHDPKTQPRSRRALAVRLAHLQCVALELTSYPMAFFLLRALTHPFLFLGREPGFLFAVRDWMGLGRDLDKARAAWLDRRRDSTKPRRLMEDLI